MDKKYLKTVLSAFADTVRAVISEEPQPRQHTASAKE